MPLSSRSVFSNVAVLRRRGIRRDRAGGDRSRRSGGRACPPHSPSFRIEPYAGNSKAAERLDARRPFLLTVADGTASQASSVLPGALSVVS
ncbi:MAG TPA: hypothetical protein DCQ98_14625 [Planctomycetaceae bacterium]|nr:hypothetical protein [Planctomycetaceae bacterium]